MRIKQNNKYQYNLEIYEKSFYLCLSMFFKDYNKIFDFIKILKKEKLIKSEKKDGYIKSYEIIYNRNNKDKIINLYNNFLKVGEFN